LPTHPEDDILSFVLNGHPTLFIPIPLSECVKHLYNICSFEEGKLDR
jgi:hypothetical protein